MKKNLIFIKIIIITALTLSTFNSVMADNRVAVDSALHYYTESEYEKALEIYLELVNNNYVSADLYYNIGNCYYKLYDIANAILWYERARLLNPSHPDIARNLEIAKSRKKDKLESMPEIFYKEWYNKTINLFNSNEWALLSFVIFIFALFSFSIFLFAKKTAIKKFTFYCAIPAIILSVLSLHFSVQQKNKLLNSNKAIVFAYSLVKSSPTESSTNLFEVNEGLKVEILEKLNGWASIRLADGKQGWIPVENIEKI